MRLLSDEISGFLSKSSWIRRMFEAGVELKAEFGRDNVFDFSLGNPDLPPPPAIATGLRSLADSMDRPLALGYMPNAGYPEVRSRLAERLSGEQGTLLAADDVIVTCGAAGGLNVFFRAVLNRGDEVLCPAPYFVEYGFYVSNYGGALKPVPAKPMTFELDIAAIDAAITPATRVVLINSPNNPCGQIYSAAELAELSAVLGRHGEANGRPIFLVSDEPYRFLAYDGVVVPPVLPVHPYSLIVGSFSKSLSMAGERVGYIAVNPDMPGKENLGQGMVMTNRILGYVNAPAIGQRLLLHALGHEVDIGIYDERRQAMAAVLRGAGIEFSMPKGAFYFFAKAPTGDNDKAFVDLLLAEKVLAVPGTGFGFPGYFRLAFCIDKAVIERSADAFKRAVTEAMRLAALSRTSAADQSMCNQP